MTAVHVRLRVASETYAIPVENVREVSELGEIAPVPGTPDTVLGVRNLRGQILPVYDLASVLGLEAASSRKRLLVAEDKGRQAGLAIDDVTQVDELSNPTEATESRFLRGATLADDQLVGILDVSSLFDALEQESRR